MDMTSSAIERAGGGSDTGFTASFDQDDKGSGEGYALNRADEIGERDSDWRKLEGGGGRCLEIAPRKVNLIGYFLIKETISTVRTTGASARSLSVREDILNDGEAGASGGVEYNVERFETGSVEPNTRGRERGDGGSAQRDELCGECLDLCSVLEETM